MKERIKELWVEALRSGEFIQTEGALKNSDGYCCLGVLCELHRRAFGGSKWIKIDSNAEAHYCGHTGDLPNEVIEWADFPGPEGEKGSLEETLVTMNDIAKNTFSEIADFIEANVPSS